MTVCVRIREEIYAGNRQEDIDNRLDRGNSCRDRDTNFETTEISKAILIILYYRTLRDGRGMGEHWTQVYHTRLPSMSVHILP